MSHDPITGQCLCGACRYELEGALPSGGICHCADCRRATGSAFGVSFRAERTQLRRDGEAASFSKPADSGTVLTRHFCPVCGSPLYTESEAHPDAVFIKAGSLDQPHALTLVREMWTGSRVPWATCPLNVSSYFEGRP